MKIGFISTWLAGTDGVSLETAKWATVLERMGHQVFYCAGELETGGPPGRSIPELHFRDEEAIAIGQRSHTPGAAALEAALVVAHRA